ncbi:MAG TPA: SDR family oxidoreductase [Leptospiraceae bacterium]|nr:SDR family oxidoreductase [Leptospiraceae bacterium]
MSLAALLIPKGPNGFGYGSTAEEVTEGVSLSGKTALITGCNSGLGKETMRVLAKRGARTVGTARTAEKASAACAEVGSADSKGFACELSDPASVRACVSAIKKDNIKLDIIICNAGIMALPDLQKSNGYELQFFTNHIGHFILVTGLLDSLTEEGRVVMLSSSAHQMAPSGGIEFDNLKGEKGYSSWKAYGQSKMANLLFAKELAARFAGTKKTAFSLHPGVIQTNLGRHMNPVMNFFFSLGNPLFFKTVEQGAATQCYVAVSKDITSLSGSFFADCNPAKPRKDAENKETAKKLWEVSEKIVSEV